MATNAFERVEDARVDLALKKLSRSMWPRGRRQRKQRSAFKSVSEKRRESRKLAARRRQPPPAISRIGQAILMVAQHEHQRARQLEHVRPQDRKILPRGFSLELAKSQGAGVVVKIMSTPPEFVIIKDKSKPAPGFVYGAKDDEEQGIVDADIFAAAKREVLEEIFKDLEIVFELTEDDIIDTISRRDLTEPGGKHYKTFFLLELPPGTEVNPGDDQEWAETFTAEEVDKLFAQGHLDDHFTIWGIVKNRGLHR